MVVMEHTQRRHKMSKKTNNPITTQISIIANSLKGIPPKRDKDNNIVKRNAMDYTEIIITKSPSLIISHASRIWIYIDGAYYAIESQAKTENFIKLCIMQIDNVRFVPASVISSVLAQLFLEYKELYPIENSNATYINMKSNVLALYKDGSIKTLPHDEKYHFTYKLNYDYDEHAQCPIFDKFLKSSLVCNDLINVVIEYLGYILNNNAKRHEKALFLYGDGSNGKSTFLNIVMALLGRENLSFVELTEMSDMGKCALMDSKLLNISSDANKKGLDTGAFKKIVSGEPILGKFLFKNIYTISLLPKLIVAMNKLPFHNGDNSHGFFRRLLLVPFTVIIKEEDKDYDLERKVIENELSAILNLVIKGIGRLNTQGKFTEAQAMKDAMNNYKESSNHVEAFIDEEQYQAVSKDTKTGTSLKELYKHFTQWCKDYGHNPYTSTYLGTELNHLGYEAYKNSSKHYRIVQKKLENETNFTAVNNLTTKKENPYEL